MRAPVRHTHRLCFGLGAGTPTRVPDRLVAFNQARKDCGFPNGFRVFGCGKPKPDVAWPACEFVAKRFQAKKKKGNRR